jgi:[acyl-carrier-protein] S-malonyltransferase
MESARVKLAEVLESIEFKSPEFPVLSNITGKPHSSDPAEIKAMMLEQVVGTTNWAADVAEARAMGCDTFVEFGPGKVLCGLIKKIDAAAITLNVSDMASLEATAGGLR